MGKILKHIFRPSFKQVILSSKRLYYRATTEFAKTDKKKYYKFAQKYSKEIDYLREDLMYFEESDAKWEIKERLNKIIVLINIAFRQDFL